MPLDIASLKQVYYYMLLSREYETCANELFKKKEVDEKPLSGIGQEGVSVGAVFPLEESDYIVPTLRSKGAFLAKGVPVADCFLQLFRRQNSPSLGVWTAHHLGYMSKGVLLTSALVASSLPVGAGVALSAKLRKSGQVVLAFFGDGGSSRGDLHSCLNLASVQNLPMILVCENNLYAMTTRIEEQMRNPNIADRALGYGIPGHTVDGQNVLEVIEVVSQAVARARSGQGPTLIDAKTYRFRGHTETHDPVDGRPEEEYGVWSQRCPIKLLESHLETTIPEAELEAIRTSVSREVADAVSLARSSPPSDINDFESLVYA